MFSDPLQSLQRHCEYHAVQSSKHILITVLIAVFNFLYAMPCLPFLIRLLAVEGGIPAYLVARLFLSVPLLCFTAVDKWTH